MGIFDLFKPKEPDRTYAAIDSRDKAVAAAKANLVIPILLFPSIFGGEEVEANIVYVPEFAAEAKESFDSIVADLLSADVSLNYSVSPKYKGKSHIPSALICRVAGDRDFTSEIKIW